MKTIPIIFVLGLILLLALGTKSPCNSTSSINAKLNYIWQETLFQDGVDGSKGPFDTDAYIVYTIKDSIRVYGCVDTDYEGKTIKVLSIEKNDSIVLEKEVRWASKFYFFDEPTSDLTAALNTVIFEKKKWHHLWWWLTKWMLSSLDSIFSLQNIFILKRCFIFLYKRLIIFKFFNSEN